MVAKNIKGMSVELGAETTGLGKALKDVEQKSRSLTTELKAVERGLKLDPKNVELTAQRQKLLAEAVSNTKQKLETLKTAAKQAQEQFDRGEITEEQFRELQREVVKTEQQLKRLEAAGKKSMAEIGKSVKDAGDKMKGVGKTMTTHVTAPILATGAAAVALGNDFDKSYDKIRTGTGATGKALEGLKDDFRAVAKDVPSSFDEISTAIADLNVRTGLTGKGLQDLAVQELNLARITGTDLAQNIAGTTRLFGDWSIASEDQSKALDHLFKVSQQTGLGVDSLMQTVVQFGAPLRQLGFSFEESTAMLGKWEKEGVNTNTVLTGMKFGLKTFARQQMDAREGMKKYVAEIKNAKSPAEATGIAMKIFGMRAGPDMAAAIREGRFSYEDLITTLGDSKETINGAAKDTDDWKENLQKLWNEIKIELEPTLIKLFNALNDLVPTIKSLAQFVAGLVTAFSNLSPTWQTAILAAVAFLAVVGPVLIVLGTLISSIGTIIGILPVLGAGFAAVGSAAVAAWALITGPVGLILAGLALMAEAVSRLITGKGLLQNATELVKGKVDEEALAHDRARDALNRYNDAARDSKDADLNLEQAKLTLNRAQREQEKAHADLTAKQQDGATSADALKDAELRVRQADIDVSRSTNDLKDAQHESAAKMSEAAGEGHNLRISNEELKKKQDETADSAHKTTGKMAHLQDAFKDTGSAASHGGKQVSTDWIGAIVDSLWTSISPGGSILRAISAVKKYFGGSLPELGPFVKPQIGGLSIGQAWTEGIAKGIEGSAASLNRTMAVLNNGRLAQMGGGPQTINNNTNSRPITINNYNQPLNEHQLGNYLRRQDLLYGH